MKIHDVHLVPCGRLRSGWSEFMQSAPLKDSGLPRLEWASLGGGTVHSWRETGVCGSLTESKEACVDLSSLGLCRSETMQITVLFLHPILCLINLSQEQDFMLSCESFQQFTSGWPGTLNSLLLELLPFLEVCDTTLNFPPTLFSFQLLYWLPSLPDSKFHSVLQLYSSLLLSSLACQIIFSYMGFNTIYIADSQVYFSSQTSSSNSTPIPNCLLDIPIGCLLRTSNF